MLKNDSGTDAIKLTCDNCGECIGAGGWVTWVDDMGIDVYKCADCFCCDIMEQFEDDSEKGDN